MDKNKAHRWFIGMFFIALMVIIPSVSANDWQLSYNNDLLGYYKLDDGAGSFANNSITSGTFNNGTLINGVWNPNGLILGAYNFTADNTILNVSGDSNLINQTNLSYTFWIKPTLATCSNNYDTLVMGGTSNAQSLLVDFVSNTCQLRTFFSGGGGQHLSTGYATTGGWNFIAITHTQGGHTILYVNGTSVSDTTGNSWTDGNQLQFGASLAGSEHYTGLMDEVGVWNRTLSATEINEMYNSGFGMSYTNTTPPFSYIPYFNSTTYETSREGFTLKLNGTQTITNPFLYYNGTIYSVSSSNDGFNYTFSSSFDVSNIGAKTFYFGWQNATSSFATTNQTQTVNPISLSLCNATNTVAYINYTFKDEETSADIVAALTATFSYYLGSGSVTKTLSFTNTTANPSYSFCFTPSDKTLFVTPNLQYSNSSYATRTYNFPSAQTYTNNTFNQTLLLLKTTSGLFVSFQVVTQALQPINNVLISIMNGNNIVETKNTDSAGIATFFLNPNTPYNITASKTGFNTFTTTIVPTQTSYTITLSSSSTGNITSYNNGISFVVSPTPPYLVNGTTYNFNVTLSSSYLNLDSWGFNITNSTALISSNSSGSGGIGNLGLLNNPINVDNYGNIQLNVFWIFQNVTTYQTIYYTVEDVSGGGWSISNLGNDLRNYLTTGFFGLTPIGLNIIIFILIFSIAGVVSWRFGLYSPIMIVGIIWGMVIFFDVVLGLIYYPVPFNNKFIATIMVGLIFIGLVIREGTKY